MATCIIRNAHVIDVTQGISGRYDVAVEGGRIAEIGRGIGPAGEGVAREINGEGLFLAPGFVDLHTHLREPGSETSETIESGTRAAAAGGYTTILAMANTNPPCDSETGVQYIHSRAAASGVVRVKPVATVTRGQQGEQMAELGKLSATGAVAFSDSFKPIMNADIMRRALEYTRMLGVPILEHCEDTNLSGEGVMNEGAISVRLGLKGIPRVAESTMVARNVALAAHTGGHIHICHVSTRESVEAIREGKRNGVRVTAEVTPHHLTMTEGAVLHYNTMAKMKPPLCTEEDRLALIRGLEDGTIDCIATDHAPHSGSAKESVFDAAPFGVIGMPSAFALLYTRFVEAGAWTIDFLIEKLTAGPASVLRADWGTLQKGRPADFVLLQCGPKWTLEKRHLHSRSSNCPWLGEELSGRVAATFVAGEPVFVNDEVFSLGLHMGALRGTLDGASAKPPKKKSKEKPKDKKGKAARRKKS